MTSKIQIRLDSSNTLVACPNCDGTEFAANGHAFHDDSTQVNYVYKCTKCNASNTLDKMKLTKKVS